MLLQGDSYSKIWSKGYIQRLTTEGFSFDKAKKKLHIWYGKKLIKMSPNLINYMMDDLGATWYSGMTNNLKMIATRMLFEKIFKGTIQAPANYVESFVKHHLRVKGVDWLDYYSLVLSDPHVSIGDLNMKLRYASDPGDLLRNHTIYNLTAGVYANQAINNCQILGEKFDWSASADAQRATINEMEHRIFKIREEYKLVQEFYGYAESTMKVLVEKDDLPF